MSESTDNTSTTENSSKAINIMRKGDYSVHILVEEVQGLEQTDPDHLPHPIVKITCFGESKRTEKVEEECTSYTYEEHFYFQKTDLSAIQLDSSKILIEVYDSDNSKNRKDYFGIYEFDLQYIYSMTKHSLHNNWLALANPESDDLTKVRGYLKLSISVLNDNDPRVELKLDTTSASFSLPPQIKREYKQLSIYLIRAESIPEKDEYQNPFVEIQYFGIVTYSKISKVENDMVQWNQIINIPVNVPSASQKIIIKVKNSLNNTYKKTQSIGCYEINLNDIIGKENKYESYKYIDIYGASITKKNDITDLMNENPEISSRWNGRILLKILQKDIDIPERNVQNIDQQEQNITKTISRTNLWSVKMKLYNAYYLPEQYKKYSIKITCQERQMLFCEKESQNQCIEWKYVQSMGIESLAKEKEELPDFFFYLLYKDKEICFQRIPASNFYLNSNIMVIKLFPNKCYSDDSITSINSGLLKVKITLYKSEESEKVDLSRFKDGDTDNEGNVDDLELLKGLEYLGGIGAKLKDVYTLVCVVYMSRYLIGNDSDGTNDPYVSIQCVDHILETEKKFNTVNGIWNEKLIFDNVELDLKKRSTWPILLAKVYNYNSKIFFSDENLLGYSYIWLSDSPFRINDNKLVRPKWHQLYLPESNSPQGELLMSFYIFDKEHRNLIYEMDIVPETIPYTCEINILGLRELRPLSMLPIKKAYIKFDMNSLNITGKKEDELESKSTQPKNKGNNPTINCTLNFDLNLPKEEIFMPSLQCQIYDYICRGAISPSLGVFIINMNRLIRRTKMVMDEEMKIIQSKMENCLDKGLVSNQVGALGKIDNIDHDHEKDAINTTDANLVSSSSRNDMLISNEGLNLEDEEADIKNNSHALLSEGNKKYDKDFVEANKNNSEYFVLLPQYKPYTIPGSKKDDDKKTFQIEDESKSPSSDLYMAIGYIAKPSDKTEYNKKGELINKDLDQPNNITKHYRRIFKSGLERGTELNLRSPFNNSFVRRNKFVDKNTKSVMFSNLGDIHNKIIKNYDPKDENKTYEEKEEIKKKRRLRGRKMDKETGTVIPMNLRDRNFGKFKAVIRVAEKKKFQEHKKTIESFRSKDSSILKELKSFNKYEELQRSILIKHDVIIRVYILELNDLPSKDIFGDSDPYIKIYFGDVKKFDEQKNYINNAKNAKWYKHYDILTEFPGDSTLKIEVWDYDPIFKDELIGSTSIDLEDRYFNSDWQNLKFKPVETRLLINPDCSSNQGNITLWVEIFDKKEKFYREPWQILPEPTTEVEMRLIVWETEDMEMKDVEGTSDIYVSAFVDPKNKQSTDVHYRSQNGNASFNWRIILPLTLPNKYRKLYLYAYDKDIFSKDDFISGAELDLSDILKIPKDLDVPVVFDKNYVNSVNEFEKNKYQSISFMGKLEDPDQNKFWVQCYKNNEKAGRICCSLEFLPMWKAEHSKVGLGRSNPNENPYLPPPVGRFEWSLNPIKMINQLVGPKFRRKLYCTLGIICCSIYLVCLLPYMIYHVSGQLFNPFNYGK